MAVALVLGGTLLALVLAKLFLRWRAPPRVPLPPGPRGLQGTWEFLRYALSNNLRTGADVWAQKYGGIVYFRIFGKDVVFLTSPITMRQVLTGETTSTLSSGHPTNFHGDYIMYGSKDLATQQWGEQLVHMRKLFHACLKAYGDGMDKLEQMMVNKIMALCNDIKESKVINMTAIIDQSILGILHMVLTGEDVTEPARSTHLMKNFALADLDFFLFDIDAVLTSFPILRFVPGRYGRGFRRIMKLKKNLEEEYLERLRRTYQRGVVRGFIDGMLEHQLSLRENGEDWFKDDHMRALIQDTVIAGYATTTGSLDGFFLLMTHFPDVQRRIQEELDRVVGDRTPTLRDRPNLPYLEAVTMETLRYIGHIPFPPPHQALDEFTVDGYRIPKGTTILLALTTALHQEEAFDDPWQFRPERFLDEKGQLVPNDHPNRLNSFPFGLGKRRCPGEAFAKSRMFLHIAILLKTFTFRPCADKPEVSPDCRTWESGMVMQPPDFYVTVLPRQASV